MLCALLSKHIFGRGQSFPPLRSAGPKTYKNMFLRLEIDARHGSECQRKNSYDWAPFVFFVAKSHLWLWVVTLKYRFKMHLIDAQIRDFRGLLDVCSTYIIPPMALPSSTYCESRSLALNCGKNCLSMTFDQFLKSKSVLEKVCRRFLIQLPIFNQCRITREALHRYETSRERAVPPYL